MNDSSITEPQSPGKFIFLVIALSIPLWLIGAFTPLQIMPGLPVSSLMVLCPLTASLVLVYSENQTTGITRLLKRSFSFRQIKSRVWLIPTLFLMPGIAVLAYGLLRLLQKPVPAPEFHVISTLVMFLVFLIAALAEEIGWSGYAIDAMRRRWNALQASLLLGVIWAAWHIIPFIQAERSLTWIIWQCVTLVTARVLLVWLYYNSGRSVIAVALCHTMINVSWQLFPVQGSHYDPMITGLITTFIAVLVVLVWGPRTFIHNRTV